MHKLGKKIFVLAYIRSVCYKGVEAFIIMIYCSNIMNIRREVSCVSLSNCNCFLFRR